MKTFLILVGIILYFVDIIMFIRSFNKNDIREMIFWGVALLLISGR